MLNRTKYFRKLCLSGCFFVGMISLSSTANAQFIGINVDYGIDYSAAPGSVSGYSVGISHPAPFIPNIGYSSVSFKDKDTVTDSSESNKSLPGNNDYNQDYKSFLQRSISRCYNYCGFWLRCR